MNEEPTHTDLAGRVRRLERRNRWLVIGLALVGGIVVFVAAMPQEANTITAQRFVLEDSSGNEKARWIIGEEGNPVLRLGEGEGSKRTVIGSGGLAIYQPGPNVAILGSDVLQFIDGENTVRLEAGTESAAGEIGPRIELSSEDHGQVTIGRVELETERTGSVEVRPASSVVLFNDDGNVIWKAPR